MTNTRTTLAPYPSYKPSRIDWLGDIPSHWSLRRIKHGFSERVEKGYPDEPLLAATQNHGVVTKDRYENRTVVAENGLELLKLVVPGDFVISLRSFQGGIELAHDRGIISPAYTVLKPEADTDPGYHKHLMKSFRFIELLQQHVTGIRQGQNIDYVKLGRAHIPLPPLNEQRAIADFLDRKDAEITRFIESRRRMITLLEEKKQAIINQAVTKGLDPSVPMKDSGVEWLGEIPAHWDVRPNRFLMRPRRKLVGAAADYHTLLSLTLNGVIERDMVNPEGKFPTSFETYQEVKRGDFVFCLFDIEETPRCVGLSRFEGMITGAYDVLRPVDSEYSEYLYRYYLAIDQRKALKPAYKGLRNTIRIGTFLSFGSPVPPLNEMSEIVQHINEVSDQVDRAVQLHKSEIELIQEYRTRLISDVVTGKVRVS